MVTEYSTLHCYEQAAPSPPSAGGPPPPQPVAAPAPPRCYLVAVMTTAAMKANLFASLNKGGRRY